MTPDRDLKRQSTIVSSPNDDPSAPQRDGDGTPIAIPVRAPGYLAGGAQMIGTTAPAELPVHGWPQFLSAMRYADYRRIWAGALVSNIGSWMQAVARDALIYKLGGETGKLWLGLNAFAEGVPIVLLLPLGGVLADRVSRRTILIFTNAMIALLAVILAVLAATDRLRVWHILTFSVVNACMDAMRIPANQSMLPDLVGDAEVPNAIALNSLQFNLSRVLGPALGGVTLLVLGAAWSFGLNAISFLGVIAALLYMKNPPRPRPREASVLASLRGGVDYLKVRGDLVTMILLVILGGMLTAPLTNLLPALSHDIFNRGDAGFAMLLSCFGVGAVIGAMMMTVRSGQKPTPWRAFPILVALGAVELLVAFNRSYAIGLFLVAVSGALFIGAMVRLNTAIIGSTPPSLRGRVTSLQILAFRLGLPVGGLVGGALAQSAGLAWSYGLFGAVMIVVVPFVFLGARRRNIEYQHPGD